MTENNLIFCLFCYIFLGSKINKRIEVKSVINLKSRLLGSLKEQLFYMALIAVGHFLGGWLFKLLYRQGIKNNSSSFSSNRAMFVQYSQIIPANKFIFKRVLSLFCLYYSIVMLIMHSQIPKLWRKVVIILILHQ